LGYIPDGGQVMIGIKRILCPIDFSEFSRHALDYAVATARWYESQVFALHVFTTWPVVDVVPLLPTQGIQRLALSDVDRDALTEQLRRFVATNATTEGDIEALVVEAPDVYREILAQADVVKADLIVIGSHGRSGFERLLLGSITEKVLRKATCPVMVVPRRAGDLSPSGAHFTRILCPVDFSKSSLTALKFSLSLAEEADAHLTALHVVQIPAGLYEPTAGFDIQGSARRPRPHP
jgi:universal stress protein A